MSKPTKKNPSANDDMLLGVTASGDSGTITARRAGGLHDMNLEVSPKKVPVEQALQNLAKAINVALQGDFLETELDKVYKAARVRDGKVEICHKDYIGLGDGVMATIGTAARSFQLTLQGPDPASPEGKDWVAKHGKGCLTGIVNFLGRKLDLIQEFEDKVPTYVEQMLDRLEAANMIQGWCREEWTISTEFVGLDVMITPTVAKDGSVA